MSSHCSSSDNNPYLYIIKLHLEIRFVTFVNASFFSPQSYFWYLHSTKLELNVRLFVTARFKKTKQKAALVTVGGLRVTSSSSQYGGVSIVFVGAAAFHHRLLLFSLWRPLFLLRLYVIFSYLVSGVRGWCVPALMRWRVQCFYSWSLSAQSCCFSTWDV